MLRITFDSMNILLALLTTFFGAIIVYRTRKGLDRVFSFYLGYSFILLISSFIIFNQYIGIFPNNWQDLMFTASRFLGQLLFLFGHLAMLVIIKKESNR
jgi:hypothetical protein